MAKGFKKQLQGGGFQNLTISGAAELQNMRLQSDIEINALKQQQARQKQLDESQLTDLRRSYKTEEANRNSIQKLEMNRQQLELENQQLMAKRDIENKRSLAKQKAAEAKMWAELSPKLAKNLGSLAEGLVKFNDMQSGMEQYRQLQANGAFDSFGEAMSTMNQEAVKGLQDRRNQATLANDIEQADYLGDTFRVSGYYAQKLIAKEIRNRQDQIFTDLDTYISENNLAKNPYDTADLYDFRGQELLKQFGIDPMSVAGVEIQQLFQQEGSKRQAKAVLGSKLAIYEEKLKQDKANHSVSPSQDTFDQMISTYMSGYTRTKSGAVVSHYGMVNAMEAAETVLTEMATAKPYATDWRKFKEEQLKWLSPIGPGNTKREAWTTKNPSMVQRVKEAWSANFKKLNDTNKLLNEAEDSTKLIEIDEKNRAGEFEGNEGTAKLISEYYLNKGNPNTQARIAKLLHVQTTENNKATVAQVIKAIEQNDVNEFVSLLDGLSETQINNIVDAKPFLQTINALRQAHGVNFDKEITSFATEKIKNISVGSFSLQGDATDNAKRAIKATKQLYYHLYNKRYAGIDDASDRRNQVEKDINALADKGEGVFTHIDAAEGTNTVIFTQFHNGALPNNVATVGKGADIDPTVGYLAQVLQQAEQKNLNLISSADLENIAIAVREGRDTITLPKNLRELQRHFPYFDARSYINEQFKKSELYYDKVNDKRILFIHPDIYDLARNAGGPLRQKDALKYMIGAYKDGELVKGDAL